ncbi:MAG TPA: bifunctional alpha,alpha-trehalose-phosphate synthase (UDP-forming)/trehalose-phosphatase [Bacteroidia bacterium]|nr:bifunctional alpha,alpha-trehalose-phosphate synthase (UDP-forming)/trehalose-phosphatase [Bacteroidia bacterium]
MRLIIVSNRAPVNIIKESNGYRYEESSGGLASGLRTYVDKLKKDKNSDLEITWIGWPGASVENERKVKKEILKKFGTHCVFLSEEVMEKFYEGFCNKTIWPLFHYFPAYAVYEKEYWEQYISVNKIFCDAVLEIAKPGDIIWIHDYHLMLLPAMVREKIPSAAIGFFLHIPFPSYEIFRLLPSTWRKKILEGLYGADLVGFHTSDYNTYFLRSTLRILGINNHMGEVSYGNHLLRADTFPMGIDFEKFHSAAKAKDVENEKRKLKKNFSKVKLVLSIDRQDYSKGILNRLKGYEYFLQNNPQWKQKVTMMMVIIPSRIGVESYQSIKSQIDELVGSINGKFGNVEWMPIVYQYRSLSFSELIALYNLSDVALVTPLRDGMNLIAKEFIASRTNKKGVLILSEMAGAVDELAESIIINPNNIGEISNALLQSLEMDEKVQRERIALMQKRLRNYDVFKWADDFLATLNKVKAKQQRLRAITLNDTSRKKIVAHFKKAHSRLLFLDYDGTLVKHHENPEATIPGERILRVLKKIISLKNTRIIIISGRSRQILQKWFGHLPIDLAAEHGLFIKERNKNWHLLKPIRKNWKKKILPILHRHEEKLPGSFTEEKDYSVAFHYRKSEPAIAEKRMQELVHHLENYISNMDVQILNGKYVLEVRNSGIDKGVAALHWLEQLRTKPDFVLSIGDDVTDEDLFRVMPDGAYSVKVGVVPSYAKLNLESLEDVFNLLSEFSNS